MKKEDQLSSEKGKRKKYGFYRGRLNRESCPWASGHNVFR